MRDEKGIVQLWTVSPEGEKPRQVTPAAVGVESAFTWSADGRWIAMAMDGGVGVVNANDGTWRELARGAIRPEACVFSPDGRAIAYVRVVAGSNQIFTIDVK
jgi:Tol biopolymer transport system component